MTLVKFQLMDLIGSIKVHCLLCGLYFEDFLLLGFSPLLSCYFMTFVCPPLGELFYGWTFIYWVVYYQTIPIETQ